MIQHILSHAGEVPDNRTIKGRNRWDLNLPPKENPKRFPRWDLNALPEDNVNLNELPEANFVLEQESLEETASRLRAILLRRMFKQQKTLEGIIYYRIGTGIPAIAKFHRGSELSLITPHNRMVLRFEAPMAARNYTSGWQPESPIASKRELYTLVEAILGAFNPIVVNARIKDRPSRKGRLVAPGVIGHEDLLHRILYANLTLSKISDRPFFYRLDERPLVAYGKGRKLVIEKRSHLGRGEIVYTYNFTEPYTLVTTKEGVPGTEQQAPFVERFATYEEMYADIATVLS